MAESNVNAGVHANTGFEFQKHCALYIILENFTELKEKEYFVSIEHADDVIFCFFDSAEICNIDAYQVKKSSKIWSNNKGWREIVYKLLETGKELTAKDVVKSKSYSHKLSFLSNQTSELVRIEKDKKTKENRTYTAQINEASRCVKFFSFPKELQNYIIDKLKITDQDLLNEQSNLCFEFIDLNKTAKQQKECLIGKCSTVFGKSVPDPEAAIDTIMKVFRKIELTFNQGNITDLMDESKRVYSIELNKAFNVVTDKAIAYDIWRDLKKELQEGLNIPISKRNDFEVEFDNSIDCFKDLTQIEHHKILRHVEKNRSLLDEHCNECDCIIELYELYIDSHSCKLDDQVIKATIFAAYVKVREQL